MLSVQLQDLATLPSGKEHVVPNQQRERVGPRTRKTNKKSLAPAGYQTTIPPFIFG